MEEVGLTSETAADSDDPSPDFSNPQAWKYSIFGDCESHCSRYSLHNNNNNNNNNDYTMMTTVPKDVSSFSSLLDLHLTVPFLAVFDKENITLPSEVNSHLPNVPPRQFLTWHEMCNILLLCGVKRHRCYDAMRELWKYFILLSYENLFDSSSYSSWKKSCGNHAINTSEDGDNGNEYDDDYYKETSHVSAATTAGAFAVLVRHEALNDIFYSPMLHKGKINKNMTVCLEELLEATTLALQHNKAEQFDGELHASSPPNSLPSPGYTLVVSRHAFDRCITKLLGRELRGRRITVIPLPRWNVAKAIVQQQRPLVVFCGGTSGCGKSTLSSLITTNVCVSTLLSTDTIRQSLRRSLRREDFPELFLSTYEAYLVHGNSGSSSSDNNNNNNMENVWNREDKKETIDPQRVIAAYEKQCESVLKVVDGIIEKFIARQQSIVIEGVHLLPTYMQRKCKELQARGVLCVSFLICIAKEKRHLDRFSTRAKCMALSPERNKYVSRFHNIRLIQQHLLEQAYELNMNIINNTNLDSSLMNVHTCLLDCIDHGTDSGKCVESSSGVERDREIHRGVSYYPFADPNISGKRMLALLLKWRSEKKKNKKQRWKNNNNNNNNNNSVYHSDCYISTSFFSELKRSRSAESLTPFRLHSLCTYSCVNNNNNNNSNNGVSLRDEGIHCKVNVSTTAQLSSSVSRANFIQQQHENKNEEKERDAESPCVPHIISPSCFPADSLTAAATISSNSPCWWESHALRAASVDAIGDGGSEEGSKVMMHRGRKRNNFTPDAFASQRRGAPHCGRGEGEEKEVEGVGYCELPSLMGS